MPSNRTSLDELGFVGPFQVEDMSAISRFIERRCQLDRTEYKNIHARSKECRAVFSDSSVVSEIKRFCGDGLSLWRFNIFEKKGIAAEIPWHHDRHFENADEELRFEQLGSHFSLLIALTPMTRESGLLEVITGSHVGGPPDRDTRPYHLRPPSDHFLQIPPSLQQNIMPIPLDAGEFIIFHSALLHRSLESEVSNNTRYSLIGRLSKDELTVPEALACKGEILPYPPRASE